MESFNIFTVAKKIGYVQEMIPTIEEKLPLFKKSWGNLEPFTFNSRWKIDLDRNLEVIGTGHYTVLKSLNYIRITKDGVRMNDKYQRYKNILFHFGLIIDCIRQLSRSFLFFHNKLSPGFFQEEKLTMEDILNHTKNWYQKSYDDQRLRLIESGIPITIQFQPRKEYLSFLADGKSISKFNKFRYNIQQYRNFFIHNPAIDIFWSKRLERESVVKNKSFRKYVFLNDIEKLDSADFIDPRISVNEDYKKSLEVIEEVWDILLKSLNDITSHANFQEMSKR